MGYAGVFALRRRATVVAALIAVAVVSVGLSAAPVSAAEGFEVEGDTTYRLEPQQDRVHVSVDVHLVNTMPAETVGAFIRTPYLDSFAIPALGPVRNVKARSSAGGSLSVDVQQKRGGISLLVVDLEPNLVHGAPQDLSVEFDLPGQRPRSNSITRVNQGFASWFVFGTGDPGKINVTVDVPASYEVSFSKNAPFEQSRRGERGIFRMENLRKLDNSYLFASASNEQRLETEKLTVANAKVAIKAWPGDVKWKNFAIRSVRKGLPTLEKLVGLEAPEEKLTIVESSRSYQLGYAGFYVPVFGIVEVGDELDQETLLHELSHVWFNREMFASRWISEGLAEDMSNRVLAKIGEKRRRPKPIKENDPGLVALNDWPPPRPVDPKSAKIEDYAYNASYAVMAELTEEIGLKGMREIFAAATARTMPYLGDGEPEEMEGDRDWRYFFDLAQIIGDSNKIDSLFVDHVVNESQADMLTLRTTARGEYADLVSAGDGWAPPLQIRQEMSAWSFGVAKALITQAEEEVARARKIAGDLKAIDIDAGSYLEAQYESSTDIDEFADTVDAYETTAADVTAVHKRLEAVNPIAKLGLLGTGVSMADTNAVMAEGELDKVPAQLDGLTSALDSATTRGVIVLAAAALLLLAIAAFVVTRRRRRSRAAHDAPVDNDELAAT